MKTIVLQSLRIVLVIAIASMACVAWADDSMAIRLYNNERYVEALPLVAEAAQAGSVECQRILGMMYRFGDWPGILRGAGHCSR